MLQYERQIMLFMLMSWKMSWERKHPICGCMGNVKVEDTSHVVPP